MVGQSSPLAELGPGTSRLLLRAECGNLFSLVPDHCLFCHCVLVES